MRTWLKRTAPPKCNFTDSGGSIANSPRSVSVSAGSTWDIDQQDREWLQRKYPNALPGQKRDIPLSGTISIRRSLHSRVQSSYELYWNLRTSNRIWLDRVPPLSLSQMTGRQRHRQGYGFTLTQANLRSARSLNILTALGFIQRENDTRGAYKGTVVTILH